MNKTLLTVFKIVLHVVGFPLLLALVFILNRNVIAGGVMYGVAVFVSAIVTVVMAGVYYLTYFLVRKKKNRSIRNQHIIIAIVAVCCLSGFWMLLDAFIPAPLETATSSTLRWEDLSDNWGARAEVNEKLLSDYVTINYNLGRLTSPNGETIADYIKQGPNNNEELGALLKADFASIDGDGYASYKGPSIDYAQSDRMTIPVLLHLFLDDRSDVQGAGSQRAVDNNLPALTMPMPYFDVYGFGDTEPILTDVRIYHGESNGDAAYYVTDQNLKFYDDYTDFRVGVISKRNGGWALMVKDAGNDAYAEVSGYPKQFDTREKAIAALQETENVSVYFEGGYHMKSVNWHVLDMLGTAMEMQMFDESMMKLDLVQTISGIGLDESLSSALLSVLGDVQYLGDLFSIDLVPDAFDLVANLVADDALLGSPIYIAIDGETGVLSLNPSNAHRGVMGYMEMAWLDSQGLLYIIVSLFSLRTLFYIYGPVMGLIAILLGLLREKEQKMLALEGAQPVAAEGKAEKPPKAKKEKKEKKAKKDKKGDAPLELTEDVVDVQEQTEAITADELIDETPQVTADDLV